MHAGPALVANEGRAVIYAAPEELLAMGKY